MIAQNNS